MSKTGASRLFRNLGDWKFEDVTVAAGIAPAASVVDQGLAWLKSKVGSGAEDEVGHWKQGAAFADVNNDGWLDLYVCRFNAPNLLYVNQRNGTFKEEAAARGLALADASGMGAFAITTVTAGSTFSSRPTCSTPPGSPAGGPITCCTTAATAPSPM